MQQIPLAIGPQPVATFDSFLAQRNEAVVEHLQQLGESAAPVYLWGPAGSGKTHLMRALAHRLQLQGRGVGWFDGSDPVPWTAAPGWALVIVDACDRLDAVAQAAAFTLFVETSAMGALWVAAGRLPPVDLPLRDDLRTRLAWGHVFAVHPLAEAETRAALRREADRRGIFLSDDVMSYLLSRFQRDLGHLMQLLDRLDQYALARSRAVTVALVRSMVNEERALP